MSLTLTNDGVRVINRFPKSPGQIMTSRQWRSVLHGLVVRRRSNYIPGSEILQLIGVQ